MDYLMNLHWFTGGIIFVVISAVLSVVGLYFATHFLDPNLRKKCHDVAGFTFNIVGVLYAVLLGFMVVEVNNRYNAIAQDVVREATVMLQLYRNAELFPQESRDEIRKSLRNYARLVYEEEWDRMSLYQESEHGYDHLLHLWREYYKIDPKTEKERIWLTESVAKMNALADARVIRMHNSNDSLGGMMWSLLIMGALITIFFMYFFHIDSFYFHALLTALLTGIVSFMLFLILSMDSAFSGYVHIEPDEIKKTIDRFNSL